MFLIWFVAIQMLITFMPSSNVLCNVHATDHINPNNKVVTRNATTLLQQLPSSIYSDNLSYKKYRQHYSLPQHKTPAAVAIYRNLGNYYQDLELMTSQPVSSLPVPTNKKFYKRDSEYNIPTKFDNHVLHLVHEVTPEIRPRRYTNVSAIVASSRDRLNNFIANTQASALERESPNKDVKNGSKGQPTAIKETRSYHDIFMRYDSPHQLSFGHVELNPDKHFQKRFESLNNNNDNRHRGEIVWRDAQGGYGEHHWDLMQGKLH